MAIEDALKVLIAERNKLDAAIKALQGTATISGAKRGRKPGKVVAVKAARKRTVSPSARKKMAASAKARWAAKKAAGKA